MTSGASEDGSSRPHALASDGRGRSDDGWRCGGRDPPWKTRGVLGSRALRKAVRETKQRAAGEPLMFRGVWA